MNEKIVMPVLIFSGLAFVAGLILGSPGNEITGDDFEMPLDDSSLTESVLFWDSSEYFQKIYVHETYCRQGVYTSEGVEHNCLIVGGNYTAEGQQVYSIRCEFGTKKNYSEFFDSGKEEISEHCSKPQYTGLSGEDTLSKIW